MNIAELILALRDRQVQIFRQGDRLQCRAQKGVLDPILRAAIAEHKQALLECQDDEQWFQDAPIIPTNRRRPLSLAQQPLWFLHVLDPGSAQYNMPFAYRLCGALDVAALKSALAAVCRRHEVLRTVFGEDDGTPWQRVVNERLEVPEVDLRGCTETLNGHLLREARRPFNLRRDLPVRATIFWLNEDEWVLLLIVHHIASDAWSMAIINRELAAFYDAMCSGVVADMPPVRAQYADYAQWQSSYLQGPALERLLGFWRALPSFPRLDIPADRPEEYTATMAGSYVTLTVTEELRAGLRALCGHEQVTLFMLLLSAYAIVLSRHCGQDAFPIGAVVANRNRAKFEELVGVVVNMIAIPVELDSRVTFRELLRRVRPLVLRALEHQDLPFQRFVEAVQAERPAAGVPLVSAVLSVQNTALAPLALRGMDTQWLPLDLGTVRFDVSLNAWDFPEQLRLQLYYRHDVFARATAQRLLARLITVLRTVVSNPDQALSALPSFDERERNLLTREWNNTAVEYPSDEPIHDVFAHWAEVVPQRLAVDFEGEKWTYGELAGRVRKLACWLRSRGVALDAPVGICVERSPAMVAGILGILTAGAAYVPLDPRYPRERLRMIIDDAGISIVLCDSASAGVLPSKGINLVSFDQIEAEPADLNTQFPIVPPDAACVIYFTSGTTGRPKGVVLSHRSVRNYLNWISGLMNKAGVENVPLVSSLNSDSTLKQIFEPLLRGESIWMFSQETVLQASLLLARLATRPNVAFNCVPTLWQAILETIEGDCGSAPDPPLRALLIGGEELDADLLRRTAVHFPRVPVFNLYGPSETTANSSSDCIAPGEPVTIGKPVGNTTIHLLDAHRELAPTGAVGEICIGGVGVARGYLGLPALTAECFIPDPWHPGGRLYRTGDLGRWRPDGRLEFRGRADHQVQIRGFRVEPREVASALESHPLVAHAVATMRGDADAPRRWVAYATIRREAFELNEPSFETIREEYQPLLRDHIARYLPDYMVPAAVVLLKTFPLTPNGKIDLAALPEPDYAQPDAFAAPRTPREDLLCEIWKEVLRLERVGVNDNFFRLGGDSILSLQIIARAERAGLRITPRDILVAQTIRQLAEVAREGVTVDSVFCSDDAPQFGLTSIQQRFFDLGLAEPHHFNQAVLLEIGAEWNRALLERAVARVVAHHDAFRLRFERSQNGTWQQRLGKDFPVLEVINISENADARLAEIVQRAHRDLDFTRGPIARFVYCDFGAGRTSRLLIVMHHLIVDGVSWRVILEDLRSERPLPRTSSYREWSEYVARYAKSDALASEAAHWLAVAEVRGIEFPRRAPTGSKLEEQSTVVELDLDPRTTASLFSRATVAYRTSVLDLLLVALARASERVARAGPLKVTLEGHGRGAVTTDENAPNVSRTVGWFTAVFPAVIDLGGSRELGTIIPNIRDQLRAIPGGGAGYGILRYIGGNASVRSRLARGWQPELNFNYLGRFQTHDGTLGLRLAPERVEPLRSPAGERRHLIDVDVLEFEGRLRIALRYSYDFFSASFIEMLTSSYFDALREIVSHCEAISFRATERVRS